MPINQPIVAVNTSTRASVRTTAVRITRKIPPFSDYQVVQGVEVEQLLPNSTDTPLNISGGSVTSNVITSPVDGLMTGDLWTGGSTLVFLLQFADIVNPGYYTFSFYLRGNTPAGGATITLEFKQVDAFGSGTSTVAQTAATATVDTWQRVVLTGYVSRPQIPHYMFIGLGSGQSVYLANWQFEPGASANAWIPSPPVGGASEVQDVFTEFTQSPEREGRMVAYINTNDVQVERAVLYVVVNINGLLTWKPVLSISGTIDSRTGRPYDSNLNFYSSLGTA